MALVIFLEIEIEIEIEIGYEPPGVAPFTYYEAIAYPIDKGMIAEGWTFDQNQGGVCQAAVDTVAVR